MVNQERKFIDPYAEQVECPFCLNTVKVGARVCTSCSATIHEKHFSLSLYLIIYIVSAYVNYKVSFFILLSLFGHVRGHADLTPWYFLYVIVFPIILSFFIYPKLPNKYIHKDKKQLIFRRYLHD